MAVMERGKRWHYRFRMHGKDYSGPCPLCNTKKEAQAFEAEIRIKVENADRDVKAAEIDVRKNKSIIALVENYRRELTGANDIPLEAACLIAEDKPSARKTGEQFAKMRRGYWKNFAEFMREEYPDVLHMASVRKSHCEAFVKHLCKSEGNRKLSPKTVRSIASVCSWVFTKLADDVGLAVNPWKGVVLPAPDAINREVFTPDELTRIWAGLQNDDFLRPLFVIAANTGLTEGDICTLRWDDIDWTTCTILRERRKTGVDIVLPLLPEMAAYLREMPRTGEYILPRHAEIYLNPSRRCSISRSIRVFLESCGIQKTVRRDGYRAVSVKDLHSLRHIFCYRAKKAGISESTIQKFVGHAVLEMTKHYADHDTVEDLHAEIRKLQPLFVQNALPSAEEPRRKLAELVQTLPLERVEELLRIAEENMSKKT